MHLVFLASARRDLREILRYLTRESRNASAASAFVRALQKRCETLATLPGTLGQARPDLLNDLRTVTFKNYVIFFRYRDDTLEIITIIEGHRNIPGLFA